MQRSNEPKRAIPQNCRRYGFARSAARSFWRRARRNIAAKNALSTLIIIGLRTIPLNCRKHVFARSAARSLRERQQEFEDKRREEKQALLDKAESPESRQWIEKHYPSIQTSSSGSVYALGRKPSQYDYANGVQNFFKEGEERLSPNGEGKLVLQSWNGSEWKNRALSNDTLQSDEAQVRSVMSVCAKKIAAEIGRGIGKSESIRSSVPFARGGRPKGNAPRGK